MDGGLLRLSSDPARLILVTRQRLKYTDECSLYLGSNKAWYGVIAPRHVPKNDSYGEMFF